MFKYFLKIAFYTTVYFVGYAWRYLKDTRNKNLNDVVRLTLKVWPPFWNGYLGNLRAFKTKIR